jgi:hypothetical protein
MGYRDVVKVPHKSATPTSASATGHHPTQVRTFEVNLALNSPKFKA